MTNAVPVVAILTGGQSLRMGTDKALVEVRGRRMIDWVLDAAAQVGDPLIAGPAHGTDVPAVHDDRTHGPLGGLVAAMTAAGERTVVLVAVDQPLVVPETIRRLAEMARTGLQPAVPIADDVPQVTCAAYPHQAVREAAAELGSGGSLTTLIRRIGFLDVRDWNTWGEDGRSWLSVDRPSDVRRAEGLASSG